MKKKIVCLLPLLLVPFLTSCSEDKVSLTYGTYINSSLFTLEELNTQKLLTKAKDEKETFLLAVYQGEYSEDCLCWATFKNVIVNYINKKHEMVYTYDAHSQDETIKNLKIEQMNQSTPCLYVFNGEKTVAKFTYQNRQDKAIFEDTSAEAMYTRLHKVIDKPTLYYVDLSYLSSQYTENKQMAVLFIRSGCGDCQYVLPNVILPYINKHSLATDIYVFDMQKYYDQSKDEQASETEKSQYQELKNSFGLSEKGNPTFGYGAGVVPTLQFLKNGLIDGATVFFNDSISQKDDGTFYISDSYYSEERLANLKYLKGFNKSKAVLKGMTLKEGVLQSPNGGYYWSQESASKYHQPLLEAFLDYYMF